RRSALQRGEIPEYGGDHRVDGLIGASRIDDGVKVRLPAVLIGRNHEGRQEPPGSRDAVSLESPREWRQKRALFWAVRLHEERGDEPRAEAAVPIDVVVVKGNAGSDDGKTGR